MEHPHLNQPEVYRPVSQTNSGSIPSQDLALPSADGSKWEIGWLLGALRRKTPLILNVALSTTLLVGALLLFQDRTSEPKYEGSFQLLVEPVTAEDKLSRSFARAQSSERALETQGLDLDHNSTLDYETQIRILKSPKLMEPVIQKIQIRYPQLTYESLIQNLSVERIQITKDGKQQGTRLLEISYSAKDSQEVLFVLEQISQAYLRYSLTERQTNIRQGVKFIDEQIPPLQNRVNTLQEQIATLRQRNNLMDPEKQGDEVAQQISSLRSKQVDISTELAQAKSRLQVLQRLSGDNAIAVLSEFPSFQKLLDQYQELQGQIATTSARLGENSPPMKSLRQKQENLQDVLNQEAERILSRTAAQVNILSAQQQAISQSEAQLNQKLQQLPVVARQYSDLKREFDIVTNTLEKFLSRREALAIDAAQQEVPWEITTAPNLMRNLKGEPVNLAKSNKRLLIALAVVLATILAVGIALLIEILQDVIHTPDEAKKLSKLPVLGTIPKLENLSSLDLIPSEVSHQSSSSSISQGDLLLWLPKGLQTTINRNLALQHKISTFIEAFNLLYTDIISSQSNQLPPSLIISSPKAQEGRSTIAIHLARAAAAGKKVLLVDADLRNPQIHISLGLNNTKGLSDLLASDLGMDQVIQPSLLEENLFVLTAGQLVTNPIKLFSSERARNLLHQFTRNFDIVIYDTPPLLDFADFKVLAQDNNSILLVTRLGKSKYADLSRAIENLRISPTNIIGLVANENS